MSEWGDVGVIVLAGGRSTRMGADKAQIRVGGRRLVDKLLSTLPPAAPRVVVSPADLGMPTVAEDPPFGGPVAGIAAGVTELGTPLVAVLAVDAPRSAALLPALRNALGDGDCALAVSDDGFDQPLCALWRRRSLLDALAKTGSRDAPARALVRAARCVARVPGRGLERDFDTPEALAELGPVEL
nr:molybdenum cofactor guanylyltransferase [Corynebacterium sp. UBA2622]